MIDCFPQTVAKFEFVLVKPDAHTQLGDLLRKGTGHRIFVLGGMTDNTSHTRLILLEESTR